MLSTLAGALLGTSLAGKHGHRMWLAALNHEIVPPLAPRHSRFSRALCNILLTLGILAALSAAAVELRLIS